jgi:hypothetical protein
MKMCTLFLIYVHVLLQLYPILFYCKQILHCLCIDPTPRTCSCSCLVTKLHLHRSIPEILISRPHQEVCSFHVEVFEWILLHKNKSANKGAQFVPMGIKILLLKTTNMLSMRNRNISLMSTSEYLCVESESWKTKYVREWLTTKYEYFLLPFLL